MKRPKVSVPKFALSCCVSALAAGGSYLADTPEMAPALVLGLSGLANLLNSFGGKFTGEVGQVFEKFSQVDNEDLEKCSLDALLEALILAARELPNHPDAQQSPYSHQAYQIREFAQKQLEDTLQWKLQKLIDTNALPPNLPTLPKAVGSSTHFQTILAPPPAKPETNADAQPLPPETLESEATNGEHQPEADVRTILADYALSLFPESVRALHYFSWFEQMLREGFDWQETPCHWFDLYCHCLMGNLKQDTPAYCSRAHKILLEKGVASLVVGQKEQSLKLDQLMAWATRQQQQYAQLVQLLTEFAKPRPPQPKLRTLELSDSAENNNHYRKRWVDMVGRDDAMTSLTDFLTTDYAFGWWAVTGPGGMGKSRLALETCLQYGYPRQEQIPDWEAGFIFDDDALKNTNGFDWLDWQPSRPYLIVVDYVIGREESVQTMLARLGEQSKRNTLKNKVRVLLLERNAGQQWWQNLLDDGAVKKALHKDPLELTAPDQANLWQMVQQVHRRHEKPLPDETRADVLKSIATIDPPQPAPFRYSDRPGNGPR